MACTCLCSHRAAYQGPNDQIHRNWCFGLGLRHMQSSMHSTIDTIEWIESNDYLSTSSSYMELSYVIYFHFTHAPESMHPGWPTGCGPYGWVSDPAISTPRHRFHLNSTIIIGLMRSSKLITVMVTVYYYNRPTTDNKLLDLMCKWLKTHSYMEWWFITSLVDSLTD